MFIHQTSKEKENDDSESQEHYPFDPETEY